MDEGFIHMLIGAKKRDDFRRIYDRWVLYRWATLNNDTNLIKISCRSGVDTSSYLLSIKNNIGVKALLKIRDVYVLEDKNLDGVFESFKWLNNYQAYWFKNPIFPNKFLHMPLFVIPPLFHITYLDINVRDIMIEQGKLYSSLLSGWYTAFTITPNLNPIKGRIGFLSRTIAMHSVGRVIYGLIERLTEHFEVYVYVDSLKFDNDDILKILRPKVKMFKILENLQDNVQMIVSHRLYAMVYPDPLEDMATYIFGCHRLAPIQISTWGHPGTTGLPFIDYYVSSKSFKDSQDFYSEKLVHFDSLSMYYEHLNRLLRPITEPTLDVISYLDSRKPGMGRQRFGIPLHGKNIYGTVGPPCKFSPQFITTVREILDKDSNGILILINNHTIKIHERCIILSRPLEILEFSLYIHSCDVILDSFPFGGLISAYDTLTVGRCLITLPCTRLGHFAPGFYRYMGLDEYIATDESDYIQKALRVTHDIEYKTIFENRIRQNIHKIHSDESSIQEWVSLCNGVAPAIDCPVSCNNI